MGTRRKSAGGRKASGTPAPQPQPTEKEHQDQPAVMKCGSLLPKAQKRLDTGPYKSKHEGPGCVYAYHEPRSEVNEFKIGRTKNVADGRMKDDARKNGKDYEMMDTWPVKYNMLAERVAHLDLDAVRVRPKKTNQDGTCQAGGTVVQGRLRDHQIEGRPCDAGG